MADDNTALAEAATAAEQNASDDVTNAQAQALEAAPNQEPTETPVKPEPKYATWQEALAAADPEELLKDPRIEGRIGQVADLRARKLADQQRREDDRRNREALEAAEQQRLRTLRTSADPDERLKYAEEMEARDQREAAQRAEVQRAQQTTGDVNDELTTYVRANFPKEAIDKLAGKTYEEGTHAKSVVAYIDDLTRVSRELDRKQWEADERPKLRKQLLTELNGGEDQAMEPAGRSSGRARTFNSEMECAIAFERGDITVQQMREAYASHGWR